MGIAMDVSAWWVLGSFLLGGYAGALLVGLIAMASRDGGPTSGHGGTSANGADPRYSL